MTTSRTNTGFSGVGGSPNNQGDGSQDFEALQLTSLRGPNVLPGPARRSKAPKLDVDLILTKAQAHQHFKRRNITYRNLPEFEPLYHSDEVEAQALLRDEIERLVAAASHDDPKQKSSKAGTPSSASQRSDDATASGSLPAIINLEWQSGLNGTTRDVLTCVEHLLTNLALVMYKNALLLVQNLRWCHSSRGVAGIFESALNDMLQTRKVLISRLVPHSQYIDTEPPPPLQPETASYALYDVMVDYVTSTIAKVIVESGDGPAWCNNSLAILARLSRKLKNLKTNARRYADEAISSAEFLHEDLRDERTDAGKHNVFNFDSGSYDVVDDSIYLKDYFVEQFRYRDYLCQILTSVLSTIEYGMTDQPLPTTQKIFDFNVMCQKENNFSLLVSSDAHDNISVTPNEMSMGLSVTGCNLLLDLAKQLSSRQRKPTPYGAAKLLRWWWREGTSLESGQTWIETTEESFSALIALAMASSSVSQWLAELLDFASCLEEETGEIRAFRPHTNFHLAFTFAQSREEVTPFINNDTISLARFVRHSAQDSQKEEAGNPGASLRLQYQQHKAKIGNWTIDSGTITVHRPWIVIGIVVPSLILALAGVSLMLAPYKRPKGVDPSNFMIFLWSIALSFLLVAKAFFVPDWPWHDFLRGNVACRSVTEVARISGIDEQLIILHLLNDRHGLAIKGPYDTAFNRSTGPIEAFTIGFSIDVPIDLGTLYASGFLILKVDNYERPRLVCMRGSVDASFDTRAQKSLEIVGDVPLLTKHDSVFGTKIRLTYESIHWQHVFGLYVNRTAKFV
ncbi:MAG: hypothetical protein Q9160_000511 [Pyrenula sp. 1 TL-2023]